jgi:hypothetical protein
MQLSNVEVRLGGNVLHTVPKMGVTPAEIVVLQHIHGEGSVVNVRPTGKTSRATHGQEFARLSALYDRRGGGFAAKPGDEPETIMGRLFPGAIKKLPETLAEIGMEPGAEPPTPADEPELDETNGDELGGDDSENAGASGGDEPEGDGDENSVAE